MILASLHGHAAADTLVTLFAILLVFGCLVAAGVTAFRGLWIACGLLLVVAIVAAVLLLGA